MGNIIGSYNATTGVMTLSSSGGTATLAQWQAALHAVAYSNTSSTPSTATRTVNYVVNDGTTDTLAVSSLINVTAINSAPTVTTSSTLNYTENASAQAVDNLLVVADSDNTTLANATVKIASGFVSAEDYLQFTNVAGTMGNITATYNYSTGVMNLSSAGNTATLAEWQTALRAVAYANVSDNPTTTPRTVSYIVNDGLLDSTLLTTTVNVIPVNDQPTLSGTITYTGLEDQLAPVNGTTTGMSLSQFSELTGKDPEGASVGLAVIGPVSTGWGTVWYSIDNGATWLNLTTASTGYSLTNALILDSSARVYLQGNANANGTLATVSVRGWDGTDGAVSGQLKDISALTGPTGAYAANNGTLAMVATPVNDAPVNTVPAFYSMLEDTNKWLSGLQVADVDSSNGLLTVTLSVTTGTIAVLNSTGVTVTDSGTGTVTLVGTRSNLGTLFGTTQGIMYTSPPNYNGTATLTMTTNDGGNTGAGGALTDTDTVTITIAAINDQPSSPATVTYSGVEDAGAPVNGTTTGVSLGSLAGLADTDVEGAAVGLAFVAPISATSGTVWYSVNNGTTWVNLTTASAAYTTSNALVLSSTTRIWFQPGANLNGTLATAAVRLWDGTDSATSGAVKNISTLAGASGAYSATNSTLNFDIAAVNDSPVNTVPTARTTAEDTAVTISGLQIADIDAVSTTDLMTVTLSAVNGTLNVVGNANVTVTNNLTGSVSFTGTIANINALLAAASPVAVQYTPNLNYVGTDTITMTTSDNGNRGTGGAMTDIDTIGVTITAVNDAPVNVISTATFTTAEDTALVITGIQTSDVDSTAATFSVTLAVTNGIINVAAGTGVTLATNGTASVKLTGTVSAINALLASTNAVTYTPTLNYNGAAILTVTSSDTLLTDIDTIGITVTPVNDAPVLATTSTLAYTENAVAAVINGVITLTDIDNTTEFSGKVSIGTGFLAGYDVLSFVGTTTTGNIVGTYDATTGIMSLSSAGGTATLAQWQAAFRLVKFNSTADVPGATRSIAFLVNDGALDSNIINSTINITAVNDAPVNTVPGAQTGTEDTSMVLSGLQIADVDSSAATFTVTLAITNGTLNVASGTGVTLATNGTASVKLTGTMSAINALLATTNSVTYTPTLNYNGASTLTMTTSDSALTDIDTVSITLSPVNDNPVVTPSATAAAYTENGTGVVVNSTVTVTDIDSTNLTGATITISGGYTNGDILAFTNANGITGSYANGVLTLTGSATVANYQAALRTITFKSTSDIPTDLSATRTISWLLDDGATIDNLSNTGTSTINITKVNDLPTGSVVISGTAEAGQVLTATNTLADADGLGTITYTWYAGGVAIAGATGPTYNVTAADAGKIFTVKASYTDTQGTLEAVTSAAVSYTVPGQATVNLGTFGNLIAPIQVEGKWYYYLDVNKSGAADNGDNVYYHDQLDAIFKYDINGNLNPTPGTDTNEVYHYANLNGTLVSLITTNGGSPITLAPGQFSGTSATGTSTGNTTYYDDWAAIWDATNGTSTATNIAGVPTGWMPAYYWTASMASPGVHYVMNNNGGQIGTLADSGSPYMVALEVVKQNSAPVLADTVLSMPNISTGVTAPVNGNTTAGVLVSSLVGGVTDADVDPLSAIPYTGALGGIAITGAAPGTVYYSLNGGTTWLSVASTSLSDTNALRLAADSNTRVFFKPTTPTVGTSDVLTFRAWDQLYGTEGSFADTTANGGRAQFSAAHDTVSLTVAPVVIDLNHDGQISYQSVAMDINSDGKLEQTHWVGQQDGVLVWDKYLDGHVHDNSQYAFSQYGGNTDLEGLAAGFDTNHDGIFDFSDASFNQFMVWQDLNQNGVSDAGEMKTLVSLGIKSIGLVSDGVQHTTVAGVVEEGHSTALMEDGTSILVADVSFAHDTLAYSIDTSAITGSKLSLTGSNTHIDLSSFLAKDPTIAEVDLTGTGNNSIKVSVTDVLQQAKLNHAPLRIIGNDGDVIDLSTDGHDTAQSETTINGQSYAGYDLDANGTLDLLVQHAVRVNTVTG